MKSLISACIAGAFALGFVGAASAEEWVDYTPMKGVWIKTMIHVEPSRIDDYLVGLKKTWVPSEEVLKKKGLIDNYRVQVSVNSNTTGPNVVLIEHYVSMAALDPDRERDMALDKEFQKMLPKAEGTAIQADRSKWRTQVSQEMWGDVEFTK